MGFSQPAQVHRPRQSGTGREVQAERPRQSSPGRAAQAERPRQSDPPEELIGEENENSFCSSEGHEGSKATLSKEKGALRGKLTDKRNQQNG